jgi:hypothetical protein
LKAFLIGLAVEVEAISRQVAEHANKGRKSNNETRALD